MDLEQTMQVAAAGMKVQGARMRLVAQNLANADSTAQRPGGEPYRRQTITFANQLDRELGIERVRVLRIGVDRSAFPLRYSPGHPAADADGYVLMPNVNPVTEMVDLISASRAYEANVTAMQTAKTLFTKTLELLR